jgi:hypothetical protein
MSWPFRKFPLKDDDIAHVIRSHEITLEFARTPGLAQLLNDLHNSDDLRQDMKIDPRKELDRRKITIPENATVTVHDLDDGGWEIEVRMVEGAYIYINEFNTEKGFLTFHSPSGSES